MSSDNPQQRLTSRKDWYMIAMTEPLEGCVIASIMQQEEQVRDLTRTGMLMECFRTKLCWSCVHEYDAHDPQRDEYVCKLHCWFDNDEFRQKIRLRNIERYS